MIETHEPVIEEHGGMFALHDMACAVCHVKPAVFDCQSRIFNPCWTCQEAGFKVRRKRWWQR